MNLLTAPTSPTLRSAANVVLLLLAAFAQALSQGEHDQRPPKREVRAVWITTVSGLDWPHSTVASEQQAALREMIENLRRARFNTIFFQVRGRGDAMYRSRFEPWSQLLTGTFGKDPGWDPLQFVLAEAHSKGMEVHAWFNTFLVKSSKLEIPESSPRHLVLQHPDWMKVVDGEYWIDPGIPAARKYLEDVVVDLASSYDIDGIQFDFVRYPAKPFPDDATFRKYGGKNSREDWRRDNVTAFVRGAYQRLHALKPLLKIGSAPIGIYANFASVRGLQSFSDLYQDSRRWLREGIQDYLAPQLYWSLGTQAGDPDFAAIAKEWATQDFRRQLYFGLGAYKADVRAQLPELIDLSRSLHADGFSFFRYGNIVDGLSMGGRFSSYANIPPMAWKDSVAPRPPENLRVAYTEQEASGGVFSLTWNRPTRDSEGVSYYNVYRSSSLPLDTDNPEQILDIVPATRSAYADTIRHPSSPKYYYAVSAFSRGNNESKPTPAQGVMMPEVLALAKGYALENSLGECYRPPSGSLVFFPYEVRKASPVVVKILDGSNAEVASVVDAVQEPGTYIAASDLSRLGAGEYTCLLIAGNYSEKKALHIGK